MRVLIVGAGNTGRHLADTLCRMSHEVVVVDRAPEPLAALDAQLDVMTIVGSGSSPDVLARAELDKADLMIAVTDSDEVNLVACLSAHAAGVANTVARIVNPALLRTPLLDYKQLGVNCVVSQNQKAAEEIFDILRNPGLLESVELLGGRVVIARIRIRAEGPLVGRGLGDLAAPRDKPSESMEPGSESAGQESKPARQVAGTPDSAGLARALIARVRFILGMRGETVYLPHGDTVFEAGDEIYVAVRPEDLGLFLDWVYPGRRPFEKSVIAGGGGLGLDLVQRLENESVPAVLLERNAERAGECSAALRRTLVLQGDASDQETMVNAGVGPDTAFVAITGDEELNIISCMLARKLGAAFTVALVSKTEYVPVIRAMGLLSRVVSPHLSMVNEILHFVRGRHIRDAVCLNDAPGELLHVVVRARHRWVGKPVSSLKMPGDCLIATVLREDRIHVPTGDLVIQEGDQLVIFALPDVVGRVQALFKN